MANKSVEMIKIRRILQLKEAGLCKSKIANQIPIHRNVLNSYLFRIEASNKTIKELLDLDDHQLSLIVYPQNVNKNKDDRFKELEAKHSYYQVELRKPGVTRLLLWEEYRNEFTQGYSYTQFCEHLSNFARISKATMHLYHTPAEFLQVDFAGKKLSYIDKQTGEIIYCDILVCTLPFSGYTYVEALASAKQEYLFAALNRCLEFLGGVPLNLLSDNMKQYVEKNSRYEFKFQELAQQWSVHYNINLDATRPRKPKDKPSVENSVYHSYLRIYAKLRNQEIFSLEELNILIYQRLIEHNQKPFQKLQGTRLEKFEQNEKPLLGSLPMEPFTIKHTTSAKVQKNYHVILGENNHQYSVPYQYIGQQTKIIYDLTTVEIYIGLQRIAIHNHSSRRNAYTTLLEHMPEKHNRYIESRGWDAEYFLSVASKIGPDSVIVFQKILDSRNFVEQTYKACLGLKRLAETYKHERFEAACKRALKGSKITYGVINNILENKLDMQQMQEIHQLSLFETPEHANIRGAENYK